MSVFISYRHTDRNTATAIARKLSINNIEYYLDVVDEESRNTDDITEVITKNIKQSTHLIAVISINTPGSWWVPFEIGQATIANRRICSYATRFDTQNLSMMSQRHITNYLPEYLRKWPILVSSTDLEKFIEQYRRDNIAHGINESRNKQFDSLNRGELTKAGAENFHRSLQRQL